MSHISKAAFDRALEAIVRPTIPPMIDPLSKHWLQPSLDEIRFEGRTAVMSKRAVGRLAEYSSTWPSGVYAGKMWKRRGSQGWILCWYGLTPDLDVCTVECALIRAES